MAERRMFAKSIVLSDAFLDLPLSSRCLYFTLGMLADDDGFVGNPKAIMRQCGASQDDMIMLLQKRYLLSFESGVIVIKHWRMNNYLRNDRYTSTTYLEEKSMLTIDNKGAYTEIEKLGIPGGIPTGNPGKDSIDKVSIDKDSITPITPKKETQVDMANRLMDGTTITNELRDAVITWIEYKVQKKSKYVEKGMASLIAKIANYEQRYGTQKVADLIDLSMSNNWQGIVWDKLNGSNDKISNRVSEVDNWV